ncbi:hypothetical protein F2Q70_00022883 [Brassica cretica]|uniref:Uncharacterized protein n=1 Tax=Brassica cretica TaxID=69181 RepID=A0A8S9GN53_BRACR|nr:hypothetical protein F2Q70_00022883 [Brassica cretica]
MIDVNVDGKRHLYNGSKHLSGKLEDHQPPSLLQMELQNIDRFWESSRQQVHQEVVTVRDQLEKKERDPGLSSQSERRRSQRFTTNNKIDKLTRKDIDFCFYIRIFRYITAAESKFRVKQRNYQEEMSYD